MQMLPGEKELLKSNDGSLTLTTHRVRYETKRLGARYLASVLLEKISLSEMKSKTYPVLLALAAFFVVVSTMARDNEQAVLFLLFIVCVGAYFKVQPRALFLTAGGASIYIPISGMPPDKVTEFIDSLETAKNTRYLAGRGI